MNLKRLMEPKMLPWLAAALLVLTAAAVICALLICAMLAVSASMSAHWMSALTILAVVSCAAAIMATEA